MAKYIDGFLLVVPKDKTEEYRKMAQMGRDSWMKHGAIAYYETRSDDLAPLEAGELKSRSFADMASAAANDSVWFSFIVFQSKEHRNEVNSKVMAEMSTQAADYEDMVMPFDMTKMAYGGFQVEVEG